jgi:hypothetical protein
VLILWPPLGSLVPLFLDSKFLNRGSDLTQSLKLSLNLSLNPILNLSPTLSLHLKANLTSEHSKKYW